MAACDCGRQAGYLGTGRASFPSPSGPCRSKRWTKPSHVPSRRSTHAMIGIDTNVLVRVSSPTIDGQAAVAERFIRDRCTADVPDSCPTSCWPRLAWILEQCYGYRAIEIADAIARIMRTGAVRRSSRRRRCVRARRLSSGSCRLRDCLIGHVTNTRGMQSHHHLRPQGGQAAGIQAADERLSVPRAPLVDHRCDGA